MDWPTEEAPAGFMHGWYSEAYNAKYGGVIYRRENGSTVLLSSVSDPHDSGMKWDDLEYKGLVLHHQNGGFVGATRKASCWL